MGCHVREAVYDVFLTGEKDRRRVDSILIMEYNIVLLDNAEHA